MPVVGHRAHSLTFRRTVAIFLENPPPADVFAVVTGRQDAEIVLGLREVYVYYDPGMGQSKLRIPAAKARTARYMQTIAKLAKWAAA